jgi:hypothetical protein
LDVNGSFAIESASRGVVVPEPGTMALTVLGARVLGAFRALTLKQM